MRPQLLSRIIGGERSIRSCLNLWFAAGAVNLLSIGFAWLEVRFGAAHAAHASLLTLVLGSAQLLFAAGLVVATVLVAEEAGRVRVELEQQLLETRSLASQDELTRLPNRRSMTELVAHESKQHGLQDRVLCVALLDLDFFKGINDRYGHAAGDEVLRTFSAQAARSLRAGDVIARWGGEEFLVLLPDTSAVQAQQVLERMRVTIGEVVVPGKRRPLKLTFSVGISQLTPGMPPDAAIAQADRAMFRAKSFGRDRTCVHGAVRDNAEARARRPALHAVRRDEASSWYPDSNYRTDGWPELRPVPTETRPSALESS